ncbi:MAG: adenosine deaminase [Chloroflexota bacterium]|nr:adenosine deaminase [Chloroflexota bacterium]
MTTPLHHFAADLPKIELHIHLEGAILPRTVLHLARRHGVSLPATDEDGLRHWYQFTDFKHFIEIYLVIQNLLRTPEDFELVTYDFGREMQRQNIRYAEATFTPFTHIWQDKGLTPDDMIVGLDAGRRRVADDFGVEIAWVMDIPRNLSFADGKYTGSASDPTVEMALAWQDWGVVALGLGGNEVGAPPEPFAHAFDAARAGGLHSVPHAGETVGPESVWGSIRALGAERIGHGVRSIEDPMLVDYLVRQQMPLEVNPTSNLCLGVYPSYEAHPLRRLWDAGAYVTINSDDPPLFNTTLNREYRVLIDHFGFDAAMLEQITLNALRASFLPTARKDLLEQAFLADFAALRSEHGIA